jgi:hypothetical protein
MIDWIYSEVRTRLPPPVTYTTSFARVSCSSRATSGAAGMSPAFTDAPQARPPPLQNCVSERLLRGGSLDQRSCTRSLQDLRVAAVIRWAATPRESLLDVRYYTRSTRGIRRLDDTRPGPKQDPRALGSSRRVTPLRTQRHGWCTDASRSDVTTGARPMPSIAPDLAVQATHSRRLFTASVLCKDTVDASCFLHQFAAPATWCLNRVCRNGYCRVAREEATLVSGRSDSSATGVQEVWLRSS